MTESKLNISFRLLTDTKDWQSPKIFVDHPLLDGYIHGNGSKAKDQLRTRISEQIEEGLRAKHNHRGRIIGSKAGEVFVIRWAFDGWQVEIAGPDRKFAGSSSGYESFDEAIAKAKDHIDSTFAGVAWECSL